MDECLPITDPMHNCFWKTDSTPFFFSSDSYYSTPSTDPPPPMVDSTQLVPLRSTVHNVSPKIDSAPLFLLRGWLWMFIYSGLQIVLTFWFIFNSLTLLQNIQSEKYINVNMWFHPATDSSLNHWFLEFCQPFSCWIFDEYLCVCHEWNQGAV